MSLELAPEIETSLRQYAEQQGITVNELLSRSFPPIPPDEDPVFTRMRQMQQIYGLPPRPSGRVGHIPASELFAEWDAEDALRTPEQVEADQRLWESLQNDRHPVEI